MKTLLGIDYGKRKIGLAIAPIPGNLAVPFRVLRVESDEEAIEELKKICEEESVEKIIIGIPESVWAGKKSQEFSKGVRQFAQKLSHNVSLPTEEVNERSSSKEAERLLLGEPKDMADAVAAMIILQSYLDRQQDEKY